MNFIGLLFLVAYGASVMAQVAPVLVAPGDTDEAYISEQPDHLVIGATSSRSGLLVFLGGTGSTPGSYLTLCRHVAEMGYDVISLSYPNAVAAASLRTSADSLSFGKYRQEICFGTALSPAVEVDSLNSVHTRCVQLLRYLRTTYPAQNWDRYLLDEDGPAWNKITLAGHSQGSGHAAYLAKRYAVRRVVMFAGPNDYSTRYGRPAAWLAPAGATPAQRHFGYLSLPDEVVPFERQLAVQTALGLYPRSDTVHADRVAPPFDSSHLLYTTQEPGPAILYHNTPLRRSATNAAAWNYLFARDVAVVGTGNSGPPASFKVYPNPTAAYLFVGGDDLPPGTAFRVYDVHGRTVASGVLPGSSPNRIDLSHLADGMYYLLITGRVFRFVKRGGNLP